MVGVILSPTARRAHAGKLFRYLLHAKLTGEIKHLQSGNSLSLFLQRAPTDSPAVLANIAYLFIAYAICIFLEPCSVYAHSISTPVATRNEHFDILKYNNDQFPRDKTIFLRNLSDAVTRSVDAALQDIRPSVGDFGFVDPTGAKDSTEAFRKAAASCRLVSIPPGSFKISTVAMCASNGGFIGAGESLTKILLTTPTGADAITILGKTASFLPVSGNFAHMFSDFTIDGTQAPSMTANAFNIVNSAGVVFQRILFRKVPSFAALTNDYFVTATDIHGFDLAYGTGHGFMLDGGWFIADRLFYESSTPGGLNQEAEAYIKITSAHGVFIGSGVVSHIRRGIYVNPGQRRVVEYSMYGTINFDQTSLAGIELYADGGAIIGQYANGTWASSCGRCVYAHVSHGGTIDGVDLNGMHAVNAEDFNLYLENVTHTSVLGGDFSSASHVQKGIASTAGNTVTLETGSFYTPMAGRRLTIAGKVYTIILISDSATAVLGVAPPPLKNVPYTYGTAAEQSALIRKANIALEGETKYVRIVGVHAGTLPQLGNMPPIGLYAAPNVDYLVVEDNDFVGASQDFVSDRKIAFTQAKISDNLGSSGGTKTVASGSTLTLDFCDTYQITGTKSIRSIAGPAWPGRKVLLTNMSGALSFVASESIAQSVTLPKIPSPHVMVFQNGQWFAAP